MICHHRHAPILGSAANEPEAEGPRRVSIARMQNTLMACRHVLRDIREEVRYDIAEIIAEIRRAELCSRWLVANVYGRCLGRAAARSHRRMN